MLFIYFIELKLSSKSAKIIFEIPIAIYVFYADMPQGHQARGREGHAFSTNLAAIM